MDSNNSSSIPDMILNSGNRMPAIGFGTAAFPEVSSDDTKSAILSGMKHGYRHFDTATMYQTEKILGEAIAEALDLGLIKSRDELFITSKLYSADAHPDLVVSALRTSLRNLQLDYLDLYLIHWPISSKQGKYEFLIAREDLLPLAKEDLLPLDFKSVWAAMEEGQGLGLTKSIGVSNFSCKKLEQILSTSKIPPAVNQVEMNPMWQQNKLREFCKTKGIVVAAYSPLGAKGTAWGNNRVMDSEVLNEIAKARGKTPAQICLRWAYEQGVCPVVKSYNEVRMKQNLEIFDWALSPEESKVISQLPQIRVNTADSYVSVDGPFKSLEDLWDGEI